MIREALEAYALSPTMETTFVMDRQRTIGASEIGLCSRRMYWVKTEGRVDEGHGDRWGARARGKLLEQHFYVPAMRRKYGKKLLWAGKDQKTFNDRYASATPDGLLIDQPRDLLLKDFGIADIGAGQCVLVECKSVDPRVNMSRAKEENEFQTQMQLGLVRELTVYKPEYAILSYMDASFLDEVHEFAIKFDPKVYDAGHKRAVRIKTATRPDELPPEGWIAGGKECEYCPFTQACGIVRHSVPESEAAADPQFTAEITDLCREHERLDGLKDKAEIALNTQKQLIKDRLKDKGIRRIPGVVTWSAVKGRRNYDMKGIRAAATEAGVDVEAYSTTGDPSDMLMVRVALEAEATKNSTPRKKQLRARG
ncbi:MAG: hypothetical protein EHM78_02270 [Myxococcaceae bacterium]|nr:MAG: hypothetical protein EHM78_02270 [Myxococcaceae bacterium]